MGAARSAFVPGQKLLLVFDQFEQWLHGWNHAEAALLIEACANATGVACNR